MGTWVDRIPYNGGSTVTTLARFRASGVLAAALVFASLAAITAPSASATDGYPPDYPDYPGNGTQGCTPGYWKTHPKAWVAFSRSQTVGSVFTGAHASLSSQTLNAALGFRGGSTLVGAQQILLRAAVASLLNASSGIDFALTVPTVIAQTNTALASDSRSAILAQAAAFDELNNRGCPLS
jgi:hypothetical protein